MKKRNTTYRLNKVDYSIFIICSLAAAAMLFLFYRDLNSFTIKQTEEPVAKIYFKRNTAQRKFIDNDIWEVLTNSSDIYDGDRIRTSKNSEAYTEFTDSGIQIQLREKSMVQIFKNKKERSVNFIGGEIFVANNSAEEKLVVRSGKKEIAVSKESEVKLALPEVSEAAAAGEEEAEESSVVVEVVSGTVEIVEEEEQMVEPMVVSAGETVTLVPEVEKKPEPVVEPVVEEVVPEPEPEIEIEFEEAVEEPEVKTESVVETEAVVKTITEKPLFVAKPAEVIPPKPVKAGVANTVSRKIARFEYNEYDHVNHKYEYACGFQLSEGIEKNTVIPAGAVIEVTFKGVIDHDLRRFALQISTGEEQWKRAHAFKDINLNNGEGIKAGVPFVEKCTYYIDRTIVNSNTSWCGLSYGPDILDEPVAISDFEISVKVLSVSGGMEVKSVQPGFTKTLEYPSFTFGKDQWGKGKNDFDYRFVVKTEEVFKEPVSLPAGSKVKISVSGTSDTLIKWMNPELVYFRDKNGVDTEWVHTMLKTGSDDYYGLRMSDNMISKNKAFSFTKTYTIYQDFENTGNGVFLLTPSKENVRENPTFTDLKITIEVVE